MSGVRGRQFAVPTSARLALALGAVVPSMCGAAVVGVLASRGLPTGAALDEPDVLRTNVIAAFVYASIAMPLACVAGVRWTTVPTVAGSAERHAIRMAIPARLTGINATVWVSGALMLIVVNRSRPWLATTLGVATMLSATVTATLTYWWCTRVLRSHVAAVLTENPPQRRQRPGLRMRAAAAWMVGTGVPLLMLLLVAASALVVNYPGDRLAIVVLGLGGAAVLCGLVVTLFTGATVADPIDEVRNGMARIAEGDYAVTVPVFDASELGLLQAGFNSMAAGLRERERLRDIFGRHVGRDVARLAEQSPEPRLGGVHCEVAVMFVDLVGSTRMALDMAPHDLVALLNEFFATVVDVVERHGGWVNKFEGDAALAIFGAPQPMPDHAGAALAAARHLARALESMALRLTAGIGVSAGSAVAGNVGGANRYEYTVIGDPVNEAARLSEFAKIRGGIAASGVAVAAAGGEESLHWQVVGSQVLRGRDTSTDIATPLPHISS